MFAGGREKMKLEVELTQKNIDSLEIYQKEKKKRRKEVKELKK